MLIPEFKKGNPVILKIKSFFLGYLLPGRVLKTEK
jgi:hypothetical protein